MSAIDTAAELAKHAAATSELTGERAVLLETLGKHRTLLRQTVNGVSEADARRRTTTSALTLGGLLKHVIGVEDGWVEFVRTGVVRGADEWDKFAPEAVEAGEAPERDDFTLDEGDTIESLLREYDEVAARTDELVTSGDLDVSHPLPPAPWFPPGKEWSARHVLAHVIGETAQHSGHADIIRESLDGQKTMG